MIKGIDFKNRTDRGECLMQGANWIKCSDELPEVGRRVLVATNYSSIYEAVRYFDNKFNRFCREVTATHWMPLPPPPMLEGE